MTASQPHPERSGPLVGLRVIEMGAIGPVPFCGMMLADMGANILRIDRAGGSELPIDIKPEEDIVMRGRRAITVDLKSSAGHDLILACCERSDILLEGFRPGVMERLGLGPEPCRARNRKLVYGRMTGWGQTGPLALTAGHDINYISIAGVLHGIGPAAGPPTPPKNLIGDYGGGGMMLLAGVLAAWIGAARTGDGQVVDAAMVDGASTLQAVLYGLIHAGAWRDAAGANLLDGGCFYYSVYATKDGKSYAVGALEDKFFATLIAKLGFTPSEFPNRHDRATWPEYRQRLAAAFAGQTSAEWDAVFAGSDACASPVLSMAEAATHPQAQLRGSFQEIAGVIQPAPAPRFDRTPSRISRPPPHKGQGGLDALKDWGIDPALYRHLNTSTSG